MMAGGYKELEGGPGVVRTERHWCWQEALLSLLVIHTYTVLALKPPILRLSYHLLPHWSQQYLTTTRESTTYLAKDQD